MYGRIAAGQDVAVGSYTDTVVVTLDTESGSRPTSRRDRLAHDSRPRRRFHAPVQVVGVGADEVHAAERLEERRPELRELARGYAVVSHADAHGFVAQTWTWAFSMSSDLPG